jgi:hypothetical protein
MKSNTKTAARTKHNAANGKRKPKNAVATRAAAVQVIRPLTAGSLKDILWETLTDLKHENILPNRADAIAAQSREILRTIKVQLQVAGAGQAGGPAGHHRVLGEALRRPPYSLNRSARRELRQLENPQP